MRSAPETCSGSRPEGPCPVRPLLDQTQILVTEDGDDCLRAVLPPAPVHPRALHTLLEGIALWRGNTVHAVLIAEDRLGSSRVDTLFGGALWPHDLANVRFDIRHPRKRRRLRGPGDLRSLYVLHGGGR